MTGTAAARTAWTAVTTLPSLSLTWTPERIEVVNQTTALENGTWRMSFSGPTGPVNDGGNYITIWRKISGQWRISKDATMSTTPR